MGAVRSLIILNESRGRDSVGMFGYDGMYAKSAISPTTWLKQPGTRDVISQFAETGGVFGHTRGGTRGGAIDANAHPFIYGEPCKEILLCHNGVVDAPKEYAVDSMWMADRLSKVAPGNYQEALRDVRGWFALTWLDRRSGEVYFLNWDAQLAFVEEGGVLYYSSSADHLRIALSCKRNPHATNDSGEVWCWNGKGMPKQRKRFKGTKRSYTTNTMYDPLGLVGNVTKMPDGLWYASLKGPGFVPLKYQDFWNKRYPDHPTPSTNASRRYIWVSIHDGDLNWKGVWVDWQGQPLSNKRSVVRPLCSTNDDTELEPSEHGVVVVDQAGVSDHPLTEASAGDGSTSAGTDSAHGRSVLFQQNLGTRPDHALVKQDVHKRMIEAEDDDAVAKALALQDEINRMSVDRDHECPHGITKQEQEQLRIKQSSKLRDLGYAEDAIEEILFRRGYFDPIHTDGDLPPRRNIGYSYR